MEPDFELFRARLESALGPRKLYGAWLAARGIRKGSLNSALTRRAIPGVEILTKIADECGCSIDYLLGRDSAPDPIASLGEAAILADAIRQADIAAAELGAGITPEVRAELILLLRDAIAVGYRDGLTTHLTRLLAALPLVPENLNREEAAIVAAYRKGSAAQRKVMQLQAGLNTPLGGAVGVV